MFRIADLIRRTWTAVATRRPRTVKHPPPPGHRFRPGLEALDGRVLPATNVWLGTDGLLSPSSWSLGHVPTSDEDVVCDGTAGPMSNTSITMPGSLSLTFNSLSLINGYSGEVTGEGGGSLTLGSLTVDTGSVVANGSINAGTVYVTGGAVTLNSSFVATTLTVSGGALAANTGFTVSQATVSGGTTTINAGMAAGTLSVSGGVVDQGPGCDITVTSGLSWTGGTINSTANLANLILSGATALIAPTGGGTVTTGDNLNFTNAAMGTVKDGIVAFGNGAGINVLTNSTLVIAPANTGVRYERVNPEGVDGRLYIESGATIEVYRPDPNTDADDWVSSLPVDNDGGKFWIHGKITADISGEVFSTGSSVHQSGSTSVLLLENGSTLKVQNDFTLGGGKFSTVPVGTTYLQNEATVKGNMTMTAGIVELDDPAYDPNQGSHIFGTLRVTGNLTWTGGVYRPHVRVEVNGDTKTDLWIIEGTAILTNAGADGALLGPAPPENPGNYDLTGVVWTIMQCPTIQFTDETDGNRHLGWELPEQGNDWWNGRKILPTTDPNKIVLERTSP